MVRCWRTITDNKRQSWTPRPSTFIRLFNTVDTIAIAWRALDRGKPVDVLPVWGLQLATVEGHIAGANAALGVFQV